MDDVAPLLIRAAVLSAGAEPAVQIAHETIFDDAPGGTAVTVLLGELGTRLHREIKAVLDPRGILSPGTGPAA